MTREVPLPLVARLREPADLLDLVSPRAIVRERLERAGGRTRLEADRPAEAHREIVLVRSVVSPSRKAIGSGGSAGRPNVIVAKTDENAWETLGDLGRLDDRCATGRPDDGLGQTPHAPETAEEEDRVRPGRTTKAWRSHRAGGPETLVLDEIPVGEPGPGEVVVRVEAVGVNFPDSLLIRDLYQVKPARPLVPGGEFCGVVAETGAGVTGFGPGDVVIGVCGWGALSEHLVVPADRLVRIPGGLPRAPAAAFLFTYATAYHALQDAAYLRRGETVLVLGAAGGVGSAAVEVAVALGAEVIAGASSQEKVDFALRHGARTGLVYDRDLRPGDGQKALSARLKEIAPRGVDVVVDPVGGPYAEPALRSLARGGRYLVVGFTAGIPRVPLNVALLKSSHIIGVDWRTFVQDRPGAHERNTRELLVMWLRHEIEPEVTELFPFEAAPDAITRLESRKAQGKIVVTIGS